MAPPVRSRLRLPGGGILGILGAGRHLVAHIYPHGPRASDLIVQKVEEVPLSRCDSPGANDVLFIDTSHTVRTGGDVVWLFGQVLPRLRSGVHVHIHDVFLPGDYPEQWVREGWGWNENYLVEAFLQFTPAFRWSSALSGR
jgi:hypothetical protein